MAFIRAYRDEDKEDCAFICRETLPPSLQPGNADPRVQLLAPYVWTHQFTYLSPQTCHVLDDGQGKGKVVGYCIGCPDVHAMTAVYGRFVEDVLLKDEGVASASAKDKDERERGWVNGPRLPWTKIIASDPDDEESSRGKGSLGGGGSGGGDVEQRQQKTTTDPRALEQLAFRPDLLLGHPTFLKPTLDQDSAGPRQPPLPSYRAMMHIDLLPAYQGQGWGRKLIDAFVQSVVAATGTSGSGSGRGDVAREGRADYGSGIWIGVSPENRKVLPFYKRVGFRLVMNDDDEGVVLVKDISPQQA